MSTDDVTDMRIAALEEFRHDQSELNKNISDALHRIELSLNTSIAKACPLPGHCVQLETNLRSKWEADEQRFERLEKRLNDGEEWHKAIEQRMEVKLDAMDRKITFLSKTVWTVGGAIALAIFAVPHLLNIWQTLHR